MKIELITETFVDERHSLRALKSDIGYHFELLRDSKLAFGTYFLYGEKLHKVALCLGGAAYGLFHDDELAEDLMRTFYEVEHLFGKNELTR